MVGYQNWREFRERHAPLPTAVQNSEPLSNTLYQQVEASFLQVLISETNFFSAEFELAQAQINERVAFVPHNECSWWRMAALMSPPRRGNQSAFVPWT